MKFELNHVAIPHPDAGWIHDILLGSWGSDGTNCGGGTGKPSWGAVYRACSVSSHTPYSKHMWLKPLVACKFLFSNHVNSALRSKIKLI